MPTAKCVSIGVVDELEYGPSHSIQLCIYGFVWSSFF